MRKPLQHIFLFLLIGTLQIVLFNQVSLFNLATPFVFLVVVFMIPLTLPLPIYYLICFGMGLLMDWFSSPLSIGIHTFSTLLAASLRRPAMLLSSTGSFSKTVDEFSFYKQDYVWYVFYLLPLIFIHHFSYFLLEAYSFRHFGWTLLKIFSSTFITFVFSYLICVLLYKR